MPRNTANGRGQVGIGDPVFDAFYATQVPFLADFAETETVFRRAASEPLDQIGEAIVITHSQGGSSGWVLADARPDLVRAIVAVEPSGPPFISVSARFQEAGATLGNGPRGSSDWGITDTPLTYDPPVHDPGPLRAAWEKRPPADHDRGQPDHRAKPRLADLADIPVLMLTGEASYHVDRDLLTVEYLRHAGVEVTAWQLGDHGVPGNGHMMMIENNNADIADLIAKWLTATVEDVSRG